MRRFEKQRSEKKKRKSRLSRMINKFLIIIGLTLLMKGLKGWLRSKKNELIH